MQISTWRIKKREKKKKTRGSHRSLRRRSSFKERRGEGLVKLEIRRIWTRIVHFCLRFTLSERTSPFGRNLANNNVYPVAQNPQNSTLVAAKFLDWRGTIQSRASRYWFKPPPRKRGLNCWNFFIGEVVKCFMAERGNAMTMSY